MFFLKYLVKWFIISIIFAMGYIITYSLMYKYFVFPRMEIPIIMSSFIIFIILFFSINHYVAVSRLRYGLSEETLKTYHKREMDLCLPFNETFELSLNSFTQIKHCFIKKKNINSGIIIMKAPDFYSAPFGNIIRFKLTPKTNDITNIIVECYPALRTILIDNGANLKNIEIIIKYLKNDKTKYCVTS